MKQHIQWLEGIAIAFTLAACAPHAANDTAQMERFVDELMGRMTLQEKIGQLNLPSGSDFVTGTVANSGLAEMVRNQQVGGVFNMKGVKKIRELQRLAMEESRLGIPLLVGADVIHGYETIFPIPLALSCSWDTLAVERMARISAIEASADGVNWTFSPMVDICRDSRWGRIAEGSGEDAYLGSLMAKAYVRGYQGEAMKASDEIMACVKHFALYGAAEAGRDYNTVDMSRQRMYNDYLPPYKAAIEQGVGSVMSAFNVVDGIPATANQWLLTDLLRQEWGFQGFVVTDYNSIDEMSYHGVAPLVEASIKAIQAGTDMDMVSCGFLNTLEASVKTGVLSEQTIDAACRRVLMAKYKLGLFDNPYKYCDTLRKDSVIFSSAHRAEARRIAAETFVLLKNRSTLLPLKREGRIALIGPLADARNNMCGMWSVACNPEQHTSLLEGLKQSVGHQATVSYAQGCNIYRDEQKQIEATGPRPIPYKNNETLLSEALSIARGSDVIVAALGECAEMSGESASRTSLTLPDAQQTLLKALVSTGKPVVLLLFTGRPLVLNWEEEHVDAILNVWFGGSETADAVCDVLFGNVVPSGKLTTSFPRSVGQLPLYYNHLNTGRPDPDDKAFNRYFSNYIDERNTPLYPFGYGLSYTTFEYGPLTLSADTLRSGQTIEVAIEVTNTGAYDGTEIVQLYLHDVYASVARPVKELKDYRRVDIKRGECKRITFTLTEETLKFYNADLKQVAEPGQFEVMVGQNSRELIKGQFFYEPSAPRH